MANSRRIDLCLVRTVRIGTDCLDMAAQDCLAAKASQVFLVTSQPLLPVAQRLSAVLEAAGLGVTLWLGPDGEPTSHQVYDATEKARTAKADYIFGLGGGSAMDIAKLVASLAHNVQNLADIGGIGLLSHRALPLALVPTTAGTGSEVTPIAIVEDTERQIKVGVVSPHLVPDVCYLDPVLTVSLPASVTAATGIDALTHCIEAYANRYSHPLVDSWALEGIRLINSHLETAVAQPANLPAREAMLLASHLGGMCLGPVNTAAVHALAYPLGGEFHIPHGVANSLLLPHVLRFNLPAAPTRYAAIAHALGIASSGNAMQDAEQGIRRIEVLSQAIGITRNLSAVGINHNALPKMAASAMTVQRLLKNNLRELREEDALTIYTAAL